MLLSGNNRYEIKITKWRERTHFDLKLSSFKFMRKIKNTFSSSKF